jgi:hypothetical protein
MTQKVVTKDEAVTVSSIFLLFTVLLYLKGFNQFQGDLKTS